MNFIRKPVFGNILWGELLLLFILASIAAIFTFPLVHFRASDWDTLLYLKTAQFTVRNAGILNRFTHIYLQKLFLAFFAPLDAAKALWSFQIFCTAIFVYLVGKLLNSKNSILTAAFALVFFLAQRDFFMRGGVPLVDFTTMLLVMVSVFVYVLYQRSKEKPASLLVLMGFLLIMVLKSKETGIIVLPLLAGAVLVGTSNWKDRARKAMFIVGGAIMGIALFMILDGWLVGDPLFSLRPESWRALLNFNLTLVYELRSPQSWYDLIFSSALLLPFLFSFFIFLEDQRGDYGWPERLIWAVPLMHVALLSATIFRASFPLNFRYLYPSFPVIAVLGAQYLRWPSQSELRQAIWTFLGSLLVSVSLFVLLYPFVASLTLRWTEDNFFSSIFTSLLLSGIFLVFLLERPLGFSRKLLLIPLVVTLLVTPILKAPRYMEVAREAGALGFSPFKVYADQIDLREGLRLFFSSQPFTEFDVLGRDGGSSENMFEVYFQIDVTQVDYSENIQDIFLADYDYAFVTRDELASSSLDDDLEQQGYGILDDPSSEIVLIARVAK